MRLDRKARLDQVVRPLSPPIPPLCTEIKFTIPPLTFAIQLASGSQKEATAPKKEAGITPIGAVLDVRTTTS
jgi:hypothetical protein